MKAKDMSGSRDGSRRRGRAYRARGRDARLLRSARLVARGRMRHALAGYLGLAAEMPANLEARNRAGDLLARVGQLARAIEIFASVADEYELQGFDTKTAALRRKILRLAPAHGTTRRASVRGLRDRGRGTKAGRAKEDYSCS